jgi:hypothetical protein
MEVVRLFDLKMKGGIGIMDMDEDPLYLKNALWYLQVQTEDMSDEEFLTWLKGKKVNGAFTEPEIFQFNQDIMSPEFAVLIKHRDQVFMGCGIIIDYLIDANNLA